MGGPKKGVLVLLVPIGQMKVFSVYQKGALVFF